MFKLEKVEIDGFWHRFNVNCQFNKDVNIIIGKNGSGKTTFMNILDSILRVDQVGLSDSNFVRAKITLVKGKQRKNIKVRKMIDKMFFEYQIANKKYLVRVFDAEESSVYRRRRFYEESSELRLILDSLTAVSSLSVYRLNNDEDPDSRNRQRTTQMLTPVDYRLYKVLMGLAEFQLEIAEQARLVSEALQKDVLASVLYQEDQTNYLGHFDFEKNEEQAKLVSAYTQLNAMDDLIKKKIKFHVSAIDKSIENNHKLGGNKKKQSYEIDIKPLEALRKTRRIIDLSLDAKKDTQDIYAPITLLLSIIKKFIPDKSFSFSSGKLLIENTYGEIELIKLSSGEKQLIILLVEALLQKNEEYIFLADEPELSLHIVWQRNIIPAVKQLNPSAQIIVATHSPEVASKYKDSTFNMEDFFDGI